MTSKNNNVAISNNNNNNNNNAAINAAAQGVENAVSNAAVSTRRGGIDVTAYGTACDNARKTIIAALSSAVDAVRYDSARKSLSAVIRGLDARVEEADTLGNFQEEDALKAERAAAKVHERRNKDLHATGRGDLPAVYTFAVKAWDKAVKDINKPDANLADHVSTFLHNVGIADTDKDCALVGRIVKALTMATVTRTGADAVKAFRANEENAFTTYKAPTGLAVAMVVSSTIYTAAVKAGRYHAVELDDADTIDYYKA